MQHILIVGASRGIGLALVEAYLAQGDQVTAVIRRPNNDALDALAQANPERLKQVLCDITEDGAASRIAQAVDTPLDVALINAGISGSQDIDGVDRDAIGTLFLTNALAPVRIARALASKMSANGVLAVTSSQMGSVALALSAGLPIYGASKAALNSLLQSWSQAEDRPAATLLALHPGWVRTDMGGSNADVAVNDSAQGLIRTMAEHHGRGGCHFVDYQQQTLAW